MSDAGDLSRILADFAGHLVSSRKLSAQDIQRAKHLAENGGEDLGLVLTRLGLISERDLAEEISRFLTIPLVGLDQISEEPLPDDVLSSRFLLQSHIIPLSVSSDAVSIAMANPFDRGLLDAIRFATGKAPRLSVSTYSDIEAALDRLYGDGKSQISQIADNARSFHDEGLLSFSPSSHWRPLPAAPR